MQMKSVRVSYISRSCMWVMRDKPHPLFLLWIMVIIVSSNE